MAYKTDLSPGEEIKIGDATLMIIKKHGQAVSIVIDAPKSVHISKKGVEDATNQRKTHISSP